MFSSFEAWKMLSPTLVCIALVATIGWTAAGVELSENQLMDGLNAGKQYVKDLDLLETQLQNVVDDGADDQPQPSFTRYSPEANAQSKQAAVELVGRQHLSQKLSMPADEINFKAVSSSSAAPTVVCNPNYPFRSYDGTCNNLANPLYGKSNTIFQRLLPANYKDGVAVPRSGPSPRLISSTVLANESLPHYANTLMVMQWGQFVDHDLSLTPTATLRNGAEIKCCSGAQIGSLKVPSVHPECFPISIPSTDPLYGPSTSCMNLVRSTFGLNLDGSTPPSRQQININTHWIDGSQIYGSTAELALLLRNRTSGRGLLNILNLDGRPLLPLKANCCPKDPTNSCPAAQSCFIAGDNRVIEQPLLTVLHTLWVREHNRVANQLYQVMGPNFDDEFYYQHARRIVIAELQLIIYKEYLPVLIGQANGNVWNDQQQNLQSSLPNPAIYNEFATAAYRMGHSQLKSFIRLIGMNGAVTNESYFLANSFQSGARMLSPTFMDGALRGLVTTPVQKVDNCFADDIHSQLFRPKVNKLGFDLISLNLQRGRDHGLQPYIYYRKHSTQLANDFNSLADTTNEEIISYLREVYSSVQDIDLFIGGVTENPIPGALLGPTFANIIAKQFDNLRLADRFFYNDLSQPFSFKPVQLKEIEKISFARIICDNNDGSIIKIQPKVFVSPDEPNNGPIPCSSIPGINFANFVAYAG